MENDLHNIGYLDKRGASAYTTSSIRALDYARARGELTYLKLGRKVVFATMDLDAWMARFRVALPTRKHTEDDLVSR